MENKPFTETEWDKLYGGREQPWEGWEVITSVFDSLLDFESVLDVGAGRGDFLCYAERLGKKCVGLDISDWCAKRKFCDSPILVGDAARLPFEDQSFDLITTFDLPKHLDPGQLVKFLRECRRVTRRFLVLLPSSIEESDSEGIRPAEEDLAGHIIHWYADKWLQVVYQELGHEFKFMSKAVIDFYKRTNLLGLPLFQWRLLLIFRR